MNYFELQTNRLMFRKFTLDDIPAWTKFFINQPAIDYLGIDSSLSPTELASGWVNFQLKRYERDGLGHMVIMEKDSGAFLGCAGLLTRELNGVNEFEIAYSLLTEHHGKGFASEATKALLQFGIENKVCDSFISIIHKENIPSKWVALSMGMKVSQETVYNGMQVEVFRINA